MFENRIELESDESMSNRYQKLTLSRQIVFEILWDLRKDFGKKLFGGLTEAALKSLADSDPKEIGRRRFFRIAGPIRVPLTSIKEPITETF